MQGEIFAVYLLFKQGTVFIMRGKNHAVTSVILPVTGMNQPYTDGNGRDFGKRQVIAVGCSRHPAVLDAESL